MKSKLIILFIFFQWVSLHAQNTSNIYLYELKKDKKVKFIQKITSSDQYDNQPYFYNGNLYYTSQNNDHTDIRVFSLETKETDLFLNTNTSEYSPSINLSKDQITVVRVEEDGKQRLWNFPLNGGNPIIINEQVEPVGYYTWFSDNKLAMFVLGEPNSMQISDLNTGNTSKITENIGRSFHKNPSNHEEFFYIQNGNPNKIMLYSDQGVSEVANLPEGTSDFSISPNGIFFTGVGPVLFRYNANKKVWVKMIDLTKKGVTDISRIAISENGNYMAIVVKNN